MFNYNNDTNPSLRVNYTNGDVCPYNDKELLTLSIDIICDKTANASFPNATWIPTLDPCLYRLSFNSTSGC